MIKGCRRCGGMPEPIETIAAAYCFEGERIQVIKVPVTLCEQCRIDARVENAIAVQRRTLGWANELG